MTGDPAEGALLTLTVRPGLDMFKAMHKGYLHGFWQRGAAQGAKPEQPFFVNIGLGRTMTAQDLVEGRLIVELGIETLRPAEFIVLRFAHKPARP